MKSMDERRAAIKKQLRGGKRNTLRELSEAIGEERERTRNRVQVGDKLKVMLLADTRTKGEVRTVRRTVRVISKHRYLVRTSDGSSSTYAELAMYYRGKILDRR